MPGTIKIEFRKYEITNGLPFFADEAVYDISNALVYDPVMIDRQIEFEDVYKFASPSVDLRFVSSLLPLYVYNLFKQIEGLGDPDFFLGVRILKGDTEKFTGYVNSKSVDEDIDLATRDIYSGRIEFFNPEKTTNVLKFSIIDWYKWLSDNTKQPLEVLDGFTTPSLTNILSANFMCDVIDGVDLHIGTIGQTLVENDYQKLAVFGLKKNELLFEIQKHYGGYFFIRNKKLTLINRNVQTNVTPIDINPDMTAIGNRIEEYIENKYNSVLLSVRGIWSGGFVQQWAWLGYNKSTGNIDIIIANEDLDNLPLEAKYIDLRQKLTEIQNNLAYTEMSIAAVNGNTVTVVPWNNVNINTILNEKILGKTFTRFSGNVQGAIKSFTIISANEGTVTVNGWYPNPPTIGYSWIIDYTFDYSFLYKLFPLRDGEDRWKDFKNVLFPIRKVYAGINRTDIELFNKINIDNLDDEYTVFRIQESIRDDISKGEFIIIPVPTPELNLLADGLTDSEGFYLLDSNGELLVPIEEIFEPSE